MSDNDLQILKEVLELETGAVRRYERHISIIKDPQINSVLEGFKRTEKGHRDKIQALISSAQNANAERGND